MDFNDLFSGFYETFYYETDFSLDLYQEGLYSYIGIPTIILAVAGVSIFYYIINRPNFSHWYHWLIILLICAVLSFFIGYIIPRNIFIGLGYEYDIEYWGLAGWNALFSVFYFIVFSYILKWGSTNAKGTPRLFGKF